MPKEKKLVHAQIKNPILVRKTLLEFAILTTEILKSYQVTKKIRTGKKHCKAQLRNNLHEIKKLMEKLELHELPKPPSLQEPVTFKKTEKEIKHEQIRRIKQERLLDTKDSKLDTELKKLQDKLKHL